MVASFGGADVLKHARSSACRRTGLRRLFPIGRCRHPMPRCRRTESSRLNRSCLAYTLIMRGVAAAIGVVLVAALASCGGTGPSAVVIVGAAQSKTEAARTARITFSVALQARRSKHKHSGPREQRGDVHDELPGLGTIQAIQDGTICMRSCPLTPHRPRSRGSSSISRADSTS